MRAVVLAGGIGSRARPLSEWLPKPLFPILNYPVLTRVLDGLAAAGFTEVGVTTTGQSRVGDWSLLAPPNVNITWLEDPVRLGTAGSLRHHIAWFPPSEPVLVVHADRLTGVPLRHLLKFHRVHGPAATLAVSDVDPLAWDGDTVASTNGHISKYHLRPGGCAPGDAGWTGVCVLERSVLEHLRPNKVLDVAEDIFAPSALRAPPLGACHVGAVQIIDLGTERQLLDCTSIRELAQFDIHPSGVEVREGVWMEEGSNLPTDAVTVPPVVIGRGVVVASGVTLRGPVAIGHEARIGAHAVIECSIVMAGSDIEAMATVRGEVRVGPADPLAIVLRHPLAGRTRSQTDR